jgi:protein-disulfide isomerase
MSKRLLLPLLATPGGCPTSSRPRKVGTKVSHISTRLLLAALSLIAVSAAQSPLSPDAQHTAEHHIRQYVELPPDAKVTFGALRPSSEMPGYRVLPVTIADQGKTRSFDFLISADGKQMLYLSHFDLSADPYKEVMAKIDLRGRPARGAAPGAPVTVVVFDDLQCPFCAKIYATLFNLVMADYRDRVRVVFKDFPVSEQTHPWSVHAAEDANCLLAQKEVGYWVFADYVHTHLQEMNDKYAAAKTQNDAPFGPLDTLALSVAKKVKIDPEPLRACIAKQDRKAIDASLAEGYALGAGATPTIYINGERMEGAYSTEQLRAVLERALSEAAR